MTSLPLSHAVALSALAVLISACSTQRPAHRPGAAACARGRHAGRAHRARALRLCGKSAGRTRLAADLADRRRPDLADRHRPSRPIAWWCSTPTPASACATSAAKARSWASSTAPTASPCTAITCSWSSATTIACRCSRCPTSSRSARFGEKELRSPYGLWLTETEPGELEVYVTDSFMYGKKFDEVPPLAELDQRVRRYRVQFDQAGRLRSSYGGAFGDTSEAGALRMVESIAGDPAQRPPADRRRGSPPRIARCASTASAASTPAAACRRTASAPRPKAWRCGPAPTAAATGSRSTSSRR